MLTIFRMVECVEANSCSDGRAVTSLKSINANCYRTTITADNSLSLQNPAHQLIVLGNSIKIKYDKFKRLNFELPFT